MSESQARRGLGPFSGAQLTAIIIVFAVLLLAPVSAWAVAGSNVFVTDPGSGSRAYVSGAGQLNVTAAGAKAFVERGVVVSDSNVHVVVASAPGRALVVTSININVFLNDNPGQTSDLPVFVSKNDATCAVGVLPGGTALLDVTPPTLGAFAYPFNPGVVVPAGRALCAATNDSTHLRGEVNAFGYSIPASAAPTGA